MSSTHKTRRLHGIQASNYFLLFLYLAISSSVNAQETKPTIKLSVSLPDTINVQIHLNEPVRSWSFLNTYAGALGLGERIGEFRSSVPVRIVAPGEFRADQDITEFSYRVRLSPTESHPGAHVSWLTNQSGLLMLGDLIPIDLANTDATISFDVPAGWRVYPSETSTRSDSYFVSHPSKAVFLIGAPLRSLSRNVEGTRLGLALVGDWPFKQERAANSAERVLKKYFALTRFKVPVANVIIASAPLSKNEKWQAETRGTNVVLIFDPGASFPNWISQLEIILTHELFHLWVPNSLRLEGDYDWFFEGFTLYQALLTALQLKLITFDEYLNTLGRVYDSYRSYVDTLSLAEASERRWTSVATPVYDKGMLVAFLYDLEVRHQTNGQSSLSDRYPELFLKYGGKTVNANDAIMSVLTSFPATESLLKSYVENRRTVELQEMLKRFGILVQSTGAKTRLRLATDLTEEQIRILRSIGYRR